MSNQRPRANAPRKHRALVDAMPTTLERDATERPRAAFAHGQVFAVFDAATQDSGNVSCGVQSGSERLFVKTAGAATNTVPLLSHDARVALLRNAVRLARAVSDPALPTLRNVVESAEGPLLVYDWVEGELLRVASAQRAEPTSAFARFDALPPAELGAALDVVFRLRVELARHGYVVGDYYDGWLDLRLRRPSRCTWSTWITCIETRHSVRRDGAPVRLDPPGAGRARARCDHRRAHDRVCPRPHGASNCSRSRPPQSPEIELRAPVRQSPEPGGEPVAQFHAAWCAALS